jgi:hypothetical protein
VTADALLAYRRTGFARVPGLLDQSDLAMLEREWSRLWSDLDRAHPSIQLRGHQTKGSTADRIDPAYPLSADLQALCDDPRLTGLAEQALGRRAVLFKDKLITKSSGTHGYGLHQDWAYWTDFGAPADHLMTLQIAIDPCDAENGALEVWPAAPGLLPPPADEPLDPIPPRSRAAAARCCRSRRATSSCCTPSPRTAARPTGPTARAAPISSPT